MLSFKMKFSGVKILQGVEFSIFLKIFEWALPECSATQAIKYTGATALPVMKKWHTVRDIRMDVTC